MRPIGLSGILWRTRENSHTRHLVSPERVAESIEQVPPSPEVNSDGDPIDLRIAVLRAKSRFAGWGAAASAAPELMARAATTSDSFNAVAEPRRREILNYLAFQERAVGDIAVDLKMEQPSLSKHLRVLRKVGLVRVRRKGRHMFYRTNAEAIRPVYEWTKTLAAQWQHQ